MKDEIRTAICPKCGQEYGGYPALSRVDNKTNICPDCGTREALESIGVGSEEQEKILAIIHGRISNS
mgnify:CR=1 FL=1